jgi:hypothetical protein
MIKSRKLHKITGLILVLPMLAWTITGLIFFIKPGYQGAYEQLSIKTYPLSASLVVIPKKEWREVRLIHSILGEHLLVKLDNKTVHLDPVSLAVKAIPSEQELKTLLRDAFSRNSERYGDILRVNGLAVKTTTNVAVTLDWSTLRLSQSGQDTQLINQLYKIHYLQWTGHKTVDQFLGVLGLILLISLTLLGVRLYIKKK